MGTGYKKTPTFGGPTRTPKKIIRAHDGRMGGRVYSPPRGCARYTPHINFGAWAEVRFPSPFGDAVMTPFQNRSRPAHNRVSARLAKFPGIHPLTRSWEGLARFCRSRPISGAIYSRGVSKLCQVYTGHGLKCVFPHLLVMRM